MLHFTFHWTDFILLNQSPLILVLFTPKNQLVTPPTVFRFSTKQLLKIVLLCLYLIANGDVRALTPGFIQTHTSLQCSLWYFHLSHPGTGSRVCPPTPPPVSYARRSWGRRSESSGCRRTQPSTCGTTAANCWQSQSISGCFLPSRAW